MSRCIGVLVALALVLPLGCGTNSQPESQDDEHQKLVTTALQNSNVQILRKQLDRIPVGTPGREEVVAHLDDLVAKEKEAAATRRQSLLICSLPQYIDSRPQDLYAALEDKLGPGALGTRDFHAPYWIADIKLPTGKMQVYERDGLLDQVNIWFDVPVSRDDALMIFGFPTYIQPTEQGPSYFVWEKRFGLDKLHFLRTSGTNEVTQAMIEIR